MFTTKVTEQASDILENYFNILSQTGYYNYNSVYKILVYTEMNIYITEEDYNLIADILECLYSFECLIPYSEFNKNTNSISTIVSYSDKLNMFMSKYSKDLESHLITSDS